MLIINLESNSFKLENVCVFLSRYSEQCLCLHQVWVADRANWRIQVFEKSTGEWLGSWDNCFTEDGPYSVRYSICICMRASVCSLDGREKLFNFSTIEQESLCV